MDREVDTHMSPGERVSDVVDSVRAYAIQETIGPARGAARWLAFGSLGALFLGTGTVLLSLAVLRVVQDLGGTTLEGTWSFVPHLVSAVILAVVSVAALSRIRRTTLGKDAT